MGDRVVQAAYEHGYGRVEFVHGAADVGDRAGRSATTSRSSAGAGASRTSCAAPVRQPVAALGRGRARRQPRDRRRQDGDRLLKNTKPSRRARWPVACRRRRSTRRRRRRNFGGRAAPNVSDIAIPDSRRDRVDQRPFVRLGTLLGRHAVLVWFWDYCSLNSLRALPYLAEWDRRYRELGLRIFGVHSPQFEFGGSREQVEARSPGSGSSSRSRPIPATRSGGSTATRSGPRSISGTGEGSCATTTSPRAPTRRPSGRSRSCCSRSTRTSSCRSRSRPCATPTGRTRS